MAGQPPGKQLRVLRSYPVEGLQPVEINLMEENGEKLCLGTRKNEQGTLTIGVVTPPFLHYVAVQQPKSQTVVVKRYPANDEIIRRCKRREANMVCIGSHPNLVQIFAIDDSNEPGLAIMEYCESGSLRDVLHRLPQSISTLTFRVRISRAVGYQALMGLAYLHEVLGIMHRDINPKNLLIDKAGRLKIGDFLSVSAKVPEFEGLTGAVPLPGEKSFRAPEVFRQADPFSPPQYKNTVDVYSLGLCLLEILDNQQIDRGTTKEETHSRLQKLEISGVESLAENVEQEPLRQLIALIRKMVDEDNRPTAVVALGNKFFDPQPLYCSCVEGSDLLVVDSQSEGVRRHSLSRNTSAGQLASYHSIPCVVEGSAQEYHSYIGNIPCDEYFRRWAKDREVSTSVEARSVSSVSPPPQASTIPSFSELLYEQEYPYLLTLRRLAEMVGSDPTKRSTLQIAQAAAHSRIQSYGSEASGDSFPLGGQLDPGSP